MINSTGRYLYTFLSFLLILKIPCSSGRRSCERIGRRGIRRCREPAFDQQRKAWLIPLQRPPRLRLCGGSAAFLDGAATPPVPGEESPFPSSTNSFTPSQTGPYSFLISQQKGHK